MIKRLKKQILCIVVFGIGVPLLLILLGGNLYYEHYIAKQSALILEKHTQMVGGDVHREPGEAGGGQNRFRGGYSEAVNSYWASEIDGAWQGELNSDSGFYNYSEGELEELAQTLYQEKEKGDRGRVKDILYWISDGEKPGVLLMDFHEPYGRMWLLAVASAAGYLVTLALLVVGGIFIARKVSRPVEESFQRQKQFISDASHELKTPLAVIKANAEIMESVTEEKKWLGYIQSEVDRMSSLIENLLTLTRIENEEKRDSFAVFNLSDALYSVALPFESIAYEGQIQYEVEVPEDCSYLGNEEEMKQLAAILLDNAMKHTQPKGTVVLELRREEGGKSYYFLEVKNTGEPIPPEERDRIFERFYRVDKSRSRSQGRYGLGLAIARAIAQKHHGEIVVRCEDGWNSFSVCLSR